jgi:hypothetical protein
MTVRRSARWAVLALLLASCGSGGSTTTTTSYTLSELSKGLLTPADVGTGWVQAEQQAPASTTTVAISPTTAPSNDLCPEAGANATDFARITAGANATMVVLTAPSSTQDRPVAVIENLWIVGDASTATAHVKAAVTSCLGKSWTSANGEQQTWTSISGLPRIGDDSISFLGTARETTKTGEVEWYVPTTLARFGNVVVMLQGLDVHDAGTAPTLTIPQLDTIFTTAATKIQHM